MEFKKPQSTLGAGKQDQQNCELTKSKELAIEIAVAKIRERLKQKRLWRKKFSDLCQNKKPKSPDKPLDLSVPKNTTPDSLYTSILKSSGTASHSLSGINNKYRSCYGLVRYISNLSGLQNFSDRWIGTANFKQIQPYNYVLSYSREPDQILASDKCKTKQVDASKAIPMGQLNPPARACSYCWQQGHLPNTCPLLSFKYCQDCGKKGVTVYDCPQCSEEYRRQFEDRKRWRSLQQLRSSAAEQRDGIFLVPQIPVLRLRRQSKFANSWTVVGEIQPDTR